MKKILSLLLILLPVLAPARERVRFDDGWEFAFGNAASPALDFGCGTEYFNYLTKAASIHNEGPYTAKFDKTNAFAGYMTRSSFGIYIVHYLVIAALGYQMKMYTQLPPWSMYVILAVAVFTLSPLIYEIIRRIPFIRWCVLGEKKR